MRSLRWLLLAALVLIAAAVFGTYRTYSIIQRSQRRPLPAAIPLDAKTMAKDWEWEQSGDNGLPAVKITARTMKQSADQSRAQLNQIELRIYAKDAQHYDRIQSAYAELTTDDHKLYSPGDVQITLDVPVKGDPPHQLTSITAAAINFDSESGQAVTDRHVAFTFEQGNGTATGAAYDPSTHTLTLNSNVVVNLRGKEGEGGMPMKVETGQLSWNEVTGTLLLSPWSRLTRDQTIVNAGPATVQLENHDIKTIDSVQVHGTDKRPGKQVEYSADSVRVLYNDNHAIDHITGVGNAKLVAHGALSDTTMTGDHVDLSFVEHDGQNVLSIARAAGNGYLESKPLPDPKGDTGDTKILRSNIIGVQMKPGGKDLDRVNTESPATLEFLPNQIARHRRLVKADRINVAYGIRNEIQSLHAASLTANPTTTETYPSEKDRSREKPNLATSFTSSKTIDASFDEKGQLKDMKQSQDFRYSEGDRKAQADSATLHNQSNVMDLEKNARISDASGSTTGENIRMDQMTGDFDAKGHVFTTRLPEENKSESTMLDKGEPTLGTADHVASANRNHLIHYTGNAVLWQTSNRIQADRIDVDRDKKSIVAEGKVVTQFEDKPKEDKEDESTAGANLSVAAKPVQTAQSATPKPPLGKPAPVNFTIVKSQRMIYTDPDRLATYTGGVDFWREAMTIKSASLKSYLNEQDSDADSRVNHAFADGKVEVVQIAPDRRRLGNSEHAEYYTDAGKVILSGGEPKLNDTKTGNDTRGDKLTWFTDNDRLIVEGAPEKKSRSRLVRKK